MWVVDFLIPWGLERWSRGHAVSDKSHPDSGLPAKDVVRQNPADRSTVVVFLLFLLFLAFLSLRVFLTVTRSALRGGRRWVLWGGCR